VNCRAAVAAVGETDIWLGSAATATSCARWRTPLLPPRFFASPLPVSAQAVCISEEDTCHLAERIVAELRSVTERLPRCSVRPHCRWWLQEGRSACARCPQIVTDNYNASEEMRNAATARLRSISSRNHEQRDEERRCALTERGPLRRWRRPADAPAGGDARPAWWRHPYRRSPARGPSGAFGSPQDHQHP
jgi:hypothetical protein